MSWFHRRWVDVVLSIYVYNEHRGYTALDRLLAAVQAHRPDDRELITQMIQHRADERKHYLMFRRWFEKRGMMPLAVDRTCGHIDRFVEIIFGSRIDDLDEQALIGDDDNFEKLCRVVALTERRGFQQVEILLRHPYIRSDLTLTKIFNIIRRDEPRHWSPYEAWLDRNGRRDAAWWERAIDRFIHSELLLLKLPILFVMPGLKKHCLWPDELSVAAPAQRQAPAYLSA